jgi:hypothetical protein
MRLINKAAFAAAIIGAFALSTSGVAAQAGPEIGRAAPAFSVVDSNGKTHTLAGLRGKTVVLEWLNHGCPFVRKHYDTNNMQRLQRQYTGQGIVWLSVISSRQGEQGYSTPAEANADVKKYNGAATAVLLDTSGNMGRAYGARTTPQMYVINPRGILVYNGAIDDKPTTRHEDINGARNYLVEALTASLANRPVQTATTRPYGCSVKY